MKKPSKKEIEERMLSQLNDFMKEFGIEQIDFGKTHSIVKTDDKLAKDIYKRKRKGL